MGRRLLSYGLVTEIDKSALALYCQAWARWVEAEQQLTRFGTVIKSPNGYPVQSPYLSIANKAMEQLTRLLVEFGMSPSARSRVTIQPAVPEPSPLLPPEPYGNWDDEPDPRIWLKAVD